MKRLLVFVFLFAAVSFFPQKALAIGGCPFTCRPVVQGCNADEVEDGSGICTGQKVCCMPTSSGSDGSVGCDGDITNGINTAIGCIPINNQNAFVGWVLKWAIGIGGGIAFILILIAGFQIMTSSGDPKKLQAGQELLTSAIGGLILLIFSVFVLKIIGVDILQIPGFST